MNLHQMVSDLRALQTLPACADKLCLPPCAVELQDAGPELVTQDRWMY
jgi:hypothetical protein